MNKKSTLSFILVLYMICTNASVAQNWFEEENIDITPYHLFDLGLARINNDKYLDVFTSNHSDNQGVFLGREGAGFSPNKITQLELNQDLVFPGLEGRRAIPNQINDGLYIYWLFGRIYLESTNDIVFEGYIEFPSTVENLSETGGASTSVLSSEANLGLSFTKVDFSFESPGEIEIQPRHVGVPFQINIDQRVPLDSVYVGWRRTQAPTHNFTASLLDRHGYAWSDIDKNGKTDVLITRGGLHGDIGSYPTSIINDELLLQFDTGFIDIAEPSGIVKAGGRGRQIAWVDVNNDGRLDVYINNLVSPNLLFIRNQDGGFTELAADYGLDLVSSGAFLWLDADSDQDMDLLIKDVANREIKFYRNQLDGSFTEEVIITKAGVSLAQWTQADMDRDGDLDVFMASSQGSKLLVNNGLNFTVVDPEEYGLPSSGISAQFVDFDNDARMDLHVVPGGVYRQRPTGSFFRTQHLRDIYPAKSNRVWGLWFDADINGTLDLLAAHRLPISGNSDSNRYNAGFYKNVGTTNNWLQIDLVGPTGNSSAIGAMVELIQHDPTKKLVQYVGTSESSRYSQGHYRLYFGLNKMRSVKGLKIYWPDGQVQLHPRLEVNQLVEIEYDPNMFEQI